MDRIIFLAVFGIAVRSYFFTARWTETAFSHVATMEKSLLRSLYFRVGEF